MPWFQRARRIFDELIIFIDEARAAPGVHARARAVADQVHSSHVGDFFQSDFRAMMRACKGEWVFRMEYDEELSPEWDQPEWRDLLDGSFTFLLCSRRWITPSGGYLAAAPWWPDLQHRFFRNAPDLSTFPDRPHGIMHVHGDGATARSLAIHHHVLWLCSRMSREQKVQYYERLRPGGALGYYYLDPHPQGVEAPLPAAGFNLATEIIRTSPVAESDVSGVSISCSGVPADVDCGTMFWIEVAFRNASAVALSAAEPFPVSLSYHWTNSARDVVVHDGHRSRLFPDIAAGSTKVVPMWIEAPAGPGDYILQVTVVQDGVRWFEQQNPAILQEFSVGVRAT